MKQLLLALVLMVAIMPVSAQEAQTPAEICAANLPATDPETREYTQAEQVLEEGVDYQAILCTDAGAIYIDLFEQYTPVTVNNFVFLAQNGFYNNTNFHRVLENFMAQGGDPTNTGMGGPGYEFQDEFVGFLTFDQPGWLAMANANRPEQGIIGTNGSQFFITTVETPHLDYRHTIFGTVLEGQENVDAIELRDPQTATGDGTALETVVIITDPSTVATSYVAPETATQADIVAALSQIDELITEETQHTITEQTTEEALESAGAEAEAYFAHNHEFRITDTMSNCGVENPLFYDTSYTIDAFATAEDATTALNDSYLSTAAANDELTENTESISLNRAFYTKETTACDSDVLYAVTHWQRGRYVITAGISISATQEIPVDIFLSDLVGLSIYEPILSDILRREISS